LKFFDASLPGWFVVWFMVPAAGHLFWIGRSGTEFPRDHRFFFFIFGRWGKLRGTE
jgi:hypothetical protein